MKDGKALQSGTSHYFGDKFSKAYDVTFTGRDNQLHHPFQTSWGVSTRLVGAIIMTHGDDDGLILPPAVAPIQVVVVPIAAHKPGVSEKAAELAEKISKYARVKLDDSDNAPGWKFSQWEMKGVPLRLEIGPKDLEKNQCVLRYPRKSLHLSGRAGDCDPRTAGGPAQGPVRACSCQPREAHLGCHHHGRGEGAGQGKHRLHQDHVVRRPCLRDEDERRSRPVQPLHAV
jgi:prolyl-tRNA synthetase